MRKAKRFIKVAAALFFLTAAIIYGNILYSACSNTPVKSDAILVLGCKVNGSVPSLLLENRLQRGLELYREGYGKTIVVSGGQGLNEDLPESTVMRKWFLSHDVPESAIIEENRSRSTFENMLFSKPLLEAERLKTVVVVTSDFHMFRSLLLARRVGLDCSGAAAPDDVWTKPFNYMREGIAVIKSILLDYTGSPFQGLSLYF